MLAMIDWGFLFRLVVPVTYPLASTTDPLIAGPFHCGAKVCCIMRAPGSAGVPHNWITPRHPRAASSWAQGRALAAPDQRYAVSPPSSHRHARRASTADDYPTDIARRLHGLIVFTRRQQALFLGNKMTARIDGLLGWRPFL